MEQEITAVLGQVEGYAACADTWEQMENLVGCVSLFTNTRSCERKKTSKPRLLCWQRGRRPRELEMVMLLQLTVQTPLASCSRRTERRKVSI